MTEVTKEMIEAGLKTIKAGASRLDTVPPLSAIYLAMREKDPEWVRMRRFALQGQEMAKEQMDLGVAAENEAKRLSTELAEAVEIIKPFANSRVGRFMTDGLKYDFRIDAAHMRAARAFVEKHSKGGDAK